MQGTLPAAWEKQGLGGKAIHRLGHETNPLLPESAPAFFMREAETCRRGLQTQRGGQGAEVGQRAKVCQAGGQRRKKAAAAREHGARAAKEEKRREMPAQILGQEYKNKTLRALQRRGGSGEGSSRSATRKPTPSGLCLSSARSPNVCEV